MFARILILLPLFSFGQPSFFFEGGPSFGIPVLRTYSTGYNEPAATYSSQWENNQAVSTGRFFRIGYQSVLVSKRKFDLAMVGILLSRKQTDRLTMVGGESGCFSWFYGTRRYKRVSELGGVAGGLKLTLNPKGKISGYAGAMLSYECTIISEITLAEKNQWSDHTDIYKYGDHRRFYLSGNLDAGIMYRLNQKTRIGVVSTLYALRGKWLHPLGCFEASGFRRNPDPRMVTRGDMGLGRDLIFINSGLRMEFSL
jgi:hypothetical protein